LTVDGADDNNTFFAEVTGGAGAGRAPYQFSQDSVQEFQANSNAYSAELGRATAVVNVVTKSGTNKLHATGLWFYRDRALTAYDPIVKVSDALLGTHSPKPAYHVNQFGGDISGPIIKNRAFLFFDYDGQRNAQVNEATSTPVDRSSANLLKLDFGIFRRVRCALAFRTGPLTLL
jgi:hypothetical protein